MVLFGGLLGPLLLVFGLALTSAASGSLLLNLEGLATIDHKGQRYLIASSQGDNAYAVFRLPAVDYVGRFAVAADAFGATSETDGIEAVAGNFGPAYPDGLFLAQDGDNAPKAQNFKLVRWDMIAAALGL